MTAARSPHGERKPTPPRIVVQTSLDDLRSTQVRFLQEAARLGSVHARVPSDHLVESATGGPPRFPEAERLFLARALRPVASAALVRRPLVRAVPDLAPRFDAVAVPATEDDPDLRAGFATRGLDYRPIHQDALAGFPPFDDGSADAGGARRVVVTGCFDWLHSGHVTFFMEAARLGDLHVVVGSDANVELLKGPGHPLQSQDERRYMVGAVRSVHRALVSTGTGWMDAEPEIDAIAPHVYVVNEDGDQPEKRGFCRAHGIEFVVLQRLPHAGLPARSSTELRGF